MPNLKFLASTVPEIYRALNSESRSRDPHITPFGLILHIWIFLPVFNLSVKFDANSFIDDQYMAIWLRNAYSGQFWEILTP